MTLGRGARRPHTPPGGNHRGGPHPERVVHGRASQSQIVISKLGATWEGLTGGWLCASGRTASGSGGPLPSHPPPHQVWSWCRAGRSGLLTRKNLGPRGPCNHFLHVSSHHSSWLEPSLLCKLPGTPSIQVPFSALLFPGSWLPLGVAGALADCRVSPDQVFAQTPVPGMEPGARVEKTRVPGDTAFSAGGGTAIQRPALHGSLGRGKVRRDVSC